MANALLNKLSDNGAAVPLNETLVWCDAVASSSTMLVCPMIDDTPWWFQRYSSSFSFLLPFSPQGNSLCLLFLRKRETRFIFKLLRFDLTISHKFQSKVLYIKVRICVRENITKYDQLMFKDSFFFSFSFASFAMHYRTCYWIIVMRSLTVLAWQLK